jgi:hypothetical protein
MALSYPFLISRDAYFEIKYGYFVANEGKFYEEKLKVV